MRLLIDHNISPYIARALAAMAEPDGHEVKAKSDKFDTTASVPDIDWLSVLGQEGVGHSYPTITGFTETRRSAR